MTAFSDASERVWLCEKGHVDDHHYTTGESEWCSRCGGATTHVSLDYLAAQNRLLQEALEEVLPALEELAEYVHGGQYIRETARPARDKARQALREANR